MQNVIPVNKTLISIREAKEIELFFIWKWSKCFKCLVNTFLTHTIWKLTFWHLKSGWKVANFRPLVDDAAFRPHFASGPKIVLLRPLLAGPHSEVKLQLLFQNLLSFDRNNLEGWILSGIVYKYLYRIWEKYRE